MSHGRHMGRLRDGRQSLSHSVSTYGGAMSHGRHMGRLRDGRQSLSHSVSTYDEESPLSSWLRNYTIL